MAVAPANSAARSRGPAGRLPSRAVPAAAFNALHAALAAGPDSPTPGGEANGVGNLRPCTALTPCGTALARNTPEKNLETKLMGRLYPRGAGGGSRPDPRR